MGADAARRAALIDVAEDLFLREGYVATTTGIIAARAGMSKKTLYRMFESKAALFSELVRRRLFDLDISPQTGHGEGNQLDRLVLLVEAIALIILAPDRLALIRLILAERPKASDLQDILTRLLVECEEDVLTRWVAAEIAANRLPDCEPIAAGQMIFDIALAGEVLDQLLEIGRYNADAATPAPGLRERTAIALWRLRQPPGASIAEALGMEV